MKKFHAGEIDTKCLFFTGKGGVGKTSTASAAAVSLADQGRKVLIVSTDPASNLQDVFETELSNKVTSIETVPNLSAVNIDPEEAVNQYKERVIGPYRSLLPASAVESMEEQMSGACTVEIAAFDEFTQLLTDEKTINEFDHIIFDTAPTGHTLRLLELPQAWTSFLEENKHGASCLGPVSGLSSKKEQYQKAVQALTDKNETTLMLVTRPEITAVREALRAGRELEAIGLKNQKCILNGVFHRRSEDSTAAAFEQKQQEAVRCLTEDLPEEDIYYIPLASYNVTGIKALRRFFKEESLPKSSRKETGPETSCASAGDIAENLTVRGSGVFMTMGKGGVGKTTVAAAVAAELARRGEKVHLTTTDPAAHLTETLGSSVPDTLTVSRIDPKKETEVYKEQVLKTAGRDLSGEELAFMKEDLDSPCTEEIAVFQAFARTVEEAEGSYIIIDTAPTGHTLLLLDAARSYHKEVERARGSVTQAVEKLLPRLRDPDYTMIALVTLPEATPVLEAGRLQEDLKRAGMVPAWWVINQSFEASGTEDPLLKQRTAEERKWISRVAADYAPAGGTAVIPWQASPEKEIISQLV